MIRTEKRMKLCATLLVLNLAFIWGNSLLPGEVSGAFSDWVKELLAAVFPVDGPDTFGGVLLRKFAHFSEFAMLGLLLAWLVGMLQKKPCTSFGWGFLVACMDETIQRFVPDRGPSFRDVLIDSSGVLTGMLLLLAGYTIIKRKKSEEMNP